VTDPLATAEQTTPLSGPHHTRDIIPPSGADIINPAALAHLGERQTEALTSSHCEIHWIICILEVLCSIHRSGIRPSSSSPSSVAQLVARSAVMTAKSKQPEGFWFDPRLRRMRSFLLLMPSIHTPVLRVGRLSFCGNLRPSFLPSRVSKIPRDTTTLSLAGNALDHPSGHAMH
jgi:hypothetical protein